MNQNSKYGYDFITTSHLTAGSVEGRLSVVGYFFLWGRGAVISLCCTGASGEVRYGAHIPVFSVPGLLQGQVQSLAQSSQAVTICRRRGRSNESVLLDNSIHPRQHKTQQNQTMSLSLSSFFKCSELCDSPPMPKVHQECACPTRKQNRPHPLSLLISVGV